MERFTLLVTVMLLNAFGVTGVSAEETLDTLLPPPGWFRRHAEELNIDVQTRQRFEQMYKEKEPNYHQLKYKVERLANGLYPALVADELDEELIVKRMKALLEAESELKLYQVHVRISLLSQLTSPTTAGSVRTSAANAAGNKLAGRNCRKSGSSAPAQQTPERQRGIGHRN